jgi:hypothetical protein
MQKLQNPQYSTSSHYKWNAVFTNEPRPRQVNQTLEKKTYSEAFNISKRTGRSLWELLTPVLPDSKNKETMHTMEIALYQWMLTGPVKNVSPVNNVPFITNFQFNEEQSLSKAIKITATAKRNDDNTIELIMPALIPVKDILAPSKTQSVTFKIMAAAYNIADGTKAESYLAELTMPYNDTVVPTQNILLPAATEQGLLVIIAMSVEYTILKEDKLQPVTDNLHWMPTGIIWAGYN